MTSERLRRELEGAVQVVLAALVLTLALSAGNVRWLNLPIGRHLRWWLLGELCVLAVATAALTPGSWRRVRRPALAASAFLALGLASVAWSAFARDSAERWVAFVTVVVTGLALAGAAAARPPFSRRVVLALLAGLAAVGIGGLVNYLLDLGVAVVPANTQAPARYQGLDANPDGAAMLMALGQPLAVWLLATARSRVARLLGAGAFFLFVGSIVATGARGALVGGLAGTVVVLAAVRPRQTWPLAAAGAVFLLSIGLMQIPQPAKVNPPPGLVAPLVPLGPREAETMLPLEDEIGFPKPGTPVVKRHVLSSSGRLRAWEGALGQVAQRPLVGYGFGTEDEVFVDRYYGFISSLVENSYLGVLLQLGAVGLALLLALLAVLALPVARLRRLDLAAAAAAGVAACGLVIAVTQSYLVAAGSVGAAPFWICAFLAGAVAGARV